MGLGYARPLEQVKRDIDRDRYMTAAEAVDYGLVDEVIHPSSVRHPAVA